VAKYYVVIFVLIFFVAALVISIGVNIHRLRHGARFAGKARPVDAARAGQDGGLLTAVAEGALEAFAVTGCLVRVIIVVVVVGYILAILYFFRLLSIG
jgi:hypothetical protein